MTPTRLSASGMRATTSLVHPLASLLTLRPSRNVLSLFDTTDQRIGTVDEVIDVVSELVQGDIDWAQACTRLPAYDGVQAID
ncbi:hypothetical protein C0992_009273 [Termitomyces sp. T32_za158]|nr:hypothetical protein C0992_009273 [Termitomyces sp. T32_za158]